MAPIGEPGGDRVRPREPHLVPADLGNAQRVAEAANPPGEPAEPGGVPLLAVLEQHLEPDADPEEGHPVLLHALGERVEEVGFPQRIERRGRRADTGQDEPFGLCDLLRLRHQPAFETEPLERVDDAGGVARSVVDHVDHAGSVYGRVS